MLNLQPLKTPRDVLVFEGFNDWLLVVGCDAAGGIGPKPMDQVKVSGYWVGRLTARVALMEVLSVGAKPFALVDALCVEPKPVGADILKGIVDEARDAGLALESAITGHFEKNGATAQTGAGVTVLGMVRRNELRIGTAKRGDLLVAIGEPKVGYEVVEALREGVALPTLRDLQNILKLSYVTEVIPVGSRGIAAEARVVAQASKCRVELVREARVDLAKTAGPSTVLLAAIKQESVKEVEGAVNLPVNVVGRLI